MVSRSTVLTLSATAAALTGLGVALAVQRAQRLRPDLFPVYRPLHRLIEAGEPQQVAVIYNPTKTGVEAALRLITAELGLANWPRAKFYETTTSDPGIHLAQQAAGEGAQIVIAVGGDGTVRAVADGLAGTDTRLGIVPLGTGNLLARNLGFNITDLQACINVALHGVSQAVDMIHLELTDEIGNKTPINYVVMGGAGFDAQIMTDTREDLKAKIGWLAYVEASLRHMFTRRRPALISVDGGPAFERKVRAVLIANCGKIQGGVNLASVAEASDGQLEVIVLTPRNLLSWARMSAQFIFRRHNTLFPVVEHFVGSEVQVEFPRTALPVEVDGDVVGDAQSLQARVMPGAVKVNIYPPELEINSLSDLMEARQQLVEQQRRWWQRLLRI
ncbi:MAG: diacylglycerol kinase family protein [Rothia sp. (in: high G+C Gram-positive bacteria)]|nr:diacylglycerol kinase family protein [Rothia sp. (in: high G+C Gram-positive bacteria)]